MTSRKIQFLRFGIFTLLIGEVLLRESANAGVGAPQDSAKEPAQLSASIFVDSWHSLDETLQAIDAAAQRGERQINVVVTILVDLTEDLQIKSFGDLMEPVREYRQYDSGMRQQLKEKLSRLFARIVKHKMAIYVLPHIDAGGKVSQWRNWVNFDPLESYAGHTYADVLLGTIADALEETATPGTHIEVALSGEMGTSLFRFPASYRTIVRQLHARPQLKNMLVGISLNHDGIAGKKNPTGAKDISLSEDNRQGMQGLIDDCDFVGMSFYAPVSVTPTPDDFVRGIDRFMTEFERHGLSVSTAKSMHFSEVGIGGRSLASGEEPDPKKAADKPWEGTAVADNNPWRAESMRTLRRQYHAALLQFLAKQPARWRVTAAFEWCIGSWDPIGLGQPEFADLEIVAAIEKHNRAIKSP